MNWQQSKLRPYLLLLAILLLAFLPVSTFHFALKNDAFSDNFPNKFFFTEALRSGFLPLWNPYLNFGFPIYADPGFAFWNPITWLFGSIIGYSAYTLTIEVLLYIYLAGTLMFHLSRYLKFSFTVSITIASMYMCCGFFAGEIQHINFLTSAAFLPLLLHRFLALSAKPNVKNTCFTAIAYFMVFTGGHPAIPIATVYFVFAITVSFLLFDGQVRKKWRPLLQYHLLSILIFLLLYSPAIYSYLTVLDEYARGTPAEQLSQGSTHTGFSISSYLSFLYPFSTVKNAGFLTDDLAMRNSYFSLAGFSLAITQFSNKKPIIRALIICTVLMLILSSGGYVKTFIYSHLPLLNYIRTNGEFRVFSILCMCLLAGFALSEIQQQPKQIFFRYRLILKVILGISLALFGLNALVNFTRIAGYFSTSVIGIKSLIDKLTFTDVFLVSLIINVAVAILLLKVAADVRKISLIVIADLIMNSIIYLPFSGVGAVTLREVQAVYNKSPKGIIIPPLIDIKNIDTLPTKLTGLVGDWSFFNKKIGITRLQDYPSYFKSTETYFNSDLPETINNLPFVFLQSSLQSQDFNDNSNKQLSVNFFSPDRINISVSSARQDSVILLQNYYSHWNANVDGQKTVVDKALLTFISVPNTAGVHSIEFFYHDPYLLPFVIISLLTFIIVFILMYRNSSSSQSSM